MSDTLMTGAPRITRTPTAKIADVERWIADTEARLNNARQDLAYSIHVPDPLSRRADLTQVIDAGVGPEAQHGAPRRPNSNGRQRSERTSVLDHPGLYALLLLASLLWVAWLLVRSLRGLYGSAILAGLVAGLTVIETMR